MKKIIFILFVLSLQINAQQEPCESHVVFLLDGSSSFNNTNKMSVRDAINSFISNISDNNVFVSVIPLGSTVSGDEVYQDGINNVLYSNDPNSFTDFFANYTSNYHDINSLSVDRWNAGLSFVEQTLMNSTTMVSPDIVILFVDEQPVPFDFNSAAIARATANNLIDNGVRLYYMIFDNYGSVGVLDGNISDNGIGIALAYTSSDDIHQDTSADFAQFPAYYLSDDLSNTTSLIANLEDLLVNQDIICGDQTNPPSDDCDGCNSFKPIPEQKYVLSAWTKENVSKQVITYPAPSIELRYLDGSDTLISEDNFFPEGRIIEEWQRIFDEFTVPQGTASIEISLKNKGGNEVFFDDIRIHPFNGSMKSFVYDPVNQRLMAEQDENNYSTFYEYDLEGGLIRIKKETERGIYTIQETRSKTSIGNN